MDFHPPSFLKKLPVETRESREVPSPVRQLSRRLTREVDGKDDSDAFGAFHGEPDEEELLLERLKAPKGGGDFFGDLEGSRLCLFCWMFYVEWF